MEHPIFKAILNIILKCFGLSSSDVSKMTEKGSKYTNNNYTFIKATSIRDWVNGRAVPDSYEKFSSLCNVLMSYVLENNEFAKAGFISTLIKACPSLSDQIMFIGENHQETDLAGIVKEVLELAWQQEQTKVYIEQSIVATTDIEATRTELVVFDFDGTLTSSNFIRTSWESIWEILGYNVKECRQLHKRFDRKEISHQEWCDITAEFFIKKRLHKDQLQPIIDGLSLIDDIEEVFEELDKMDIKIFIVSGSIFYIIRNALGNLCQYTTEIKANVFDFNTEGYLERIVGTKYDFEGKAQYIKELAKTWGVAPQNILFVGNSFNDEFVHESGCRTLCINPRQTSAHDTVKWHDCIEDCKSLREVLEFINN